MLRRRLRFCPALPVQQRHRRLLPEDRHLLRRIERQPLRRLLAQAKPLLLPEHRGMLPVQPPDLLR
jgi:hypothetical protein